ncbi:MAG: hypothetical protein A2Y40_05300 [Candidatus Margulisbacteria bacterium GWF2_35_9]|nr:MAG: hypothetical protein A2Y40_05300 [Candidatus Margulisbacteria bacterium GWF2_35_9]
MLRKLEKNETINTSMFGGFSPFWSWIGEQVYIADTAEEIIQVVPKDKRILNTSSFFELMQFNYILGDSTLFQGVYRMPWHAELSHKGVIKKPPIPHGNKLVSPKDSARQLQLLLEEELKQVVTGSETVYLLLTGGLDSRVIAGVLKKIEPKLTCKIKCATWGQDNSRDVVYAKRIANGYNWEFVHIPYTAELLWENIERGAIWGASEVAGIHLHGMDWFKNIKKDDLVIAASFGDSIGRAEFSSVHLSQVKLDKITNKHRLIHPSLVDDLIGQASKDRSRAWEGEVSTHSWVKCELDQQENYMRRMLCHIMNYIRQFGKLHQAFTSDKVVEYMWSITPECRNDDVYFEILKNLDQRLYSLPWARNGIAPDGTKETDESLKKNYHDWEKWMRTDLKEKLEPLYFSKELDELNLFNPIAKKHLWETWQKEGPEAFGKGQDIVKVCSLELTRRNYLLKADHRKTKQIDVVYDLIKYGVERILKR